MEKMINKDVEKQLRQVFGAMKEDITLVLFTQEGECYSCEETKQLLSEVAELNPHISFVEKDIHKDANEASKYNVELTPSFVVLDKEGNYRGVKFNGFPGGHEINSFISALMELSGNASEVSPEIAARIAKIDKPVNIKVFVTLSCPHCPGAVQKAHKLAMLNPNITGEMIEAQTFYELSDKFNVSGVPKIIINDSLELLGNQPIESFLSSIESL